MADQNVIKEFLVALGFKVDEAKLKKFQKGIDTATKFVGKLGAGAEAMATAVEAAVVKVSSKFEDLYYASIRLSDSVENVRGMTFAIGQLGGSSKTALQALENMGEFFRSNPGAERFVRGLGVETRTANGELRGMTLIMHDLGERLRAMPYYRAKVIAGVLGIDPNTLQALLRDTGEAQSRFHDLAQRMGVDQDKAAKASHDFMNDMRELLAVITLTADKLILRLQPVVDRITRGLEDLDIATGGWSTALIVLVGILVPLLAVLDPIVVAILAIAAGLAMVDWSRWDPQIKELQNALGDLGSALADLGEALGPVAKWLTDAFGPVISDMVGRFFTKTAGALHEMADSIRIITALLHGDWKKAWSGAGDLARHELERQTGVSGPPSAANGNQAPPAAAIGHAVVQGASNVADRITEFFQKNGLGRDTARGITAGIGAESQFKTDAFNSTGGGQGAYGIGQWRGKRLAELRRRYGQSPNLQQQLEFMLWELQGGDAGGSAVLSQKTAPGALSAYVNRFMRPGAGAGGDMRRGLAYLSSPTALTSSSGPQAATKNITYTQKTDIVVKTDDPSTAGKNVASEQNRVNDAVARNLKVAAS